jgi:hypothetical protein
VDLDVDAAPPADDGDSLLPRLPDVSLQKQDLNLGDAWGKVKVKYQNVYADADMHPALQEQEKVDFHFRPLNTKVLFRRDVLSPRAG